MRVIFLFGNELIVANISYVSYDSEELLLYLSINDSTLHRQEIYIYNISKEKSSEIMHELYQTGMYDFTSNAYKIELL